MSKFNVYEWNHKRRLEEAEIPDKDERGTRVYIVMIGTRGRFGPYRVFKDRKDAEAHAAQKAKDHFDIYRDKLDTYIEESFMDL